MPRPGEGGRGEPPGCSSFSGGVRLAGERGRSDTGEFKRALPLDRLGMAVLLVGLIVRLFQLQILESTTTTAPPRGRTSSAKSPLATTRGIIRDRNGKVLAASRPAYNVYVVP